MSIEAQKRFFEKVKNEFSEKGCPNLSLSKIKGDASQRSYSRVQEGGLSYVICQDPLLDDPSDYDFFKVHKVFDDNHIPVPKIHTFIPKERAFILEDLGDKTFLKEVSQSHDLEQEYLLYKNLIDLMIKIHSLKLSKKERPITKRAFDCEKLMSEVHLTFEHFLKGLLGNGNQNAFESLEKGFLKICQEIASEKKVCVHRDFHSKNVMVKEDGSLFLIDFQDARLGLPQYDLVSLLEDCYYRVHHENKERLKAYYWETYLKRTGFQKDWERFQYLYDLSLIQRLFKAIGNFSYMFQVKGNPHYLCYIGHTFENIRMTLLKHKHLKEFRLHLNLFYYER